VKRIALADLVEQHRRLGPVLETEMRRVIASGRFVLGDEVERFEREAAAYLGVDRAVGVSSGTDALLVALRALGVGPRDEVITTPFTFVATAEAVAVLGARPRFVDVDARTLSIDAREVEAAFGESTKAVVPVHLYGSAAPVDRLAAVCEAGGVALLEDAAQAFGTEAFGRSAGAWGTLGCFSFFPGKVLGALGDAGLIVTSDDALASRCRSLRQHGRASGQYEELGGNHRLDAIQAAFLRVKLRHVRAFVDARRRHGARYDAGLAGASGVCPVARSAGWNGAVYAVRVLDGRRDALREALLARGIESAAYYSRPLHLEPAFAALGHRRGAFPVAERAAEEVLALPVHAELEDADVDRVIDEVRGFFG
jgi:dTDP-4-amino-4,6-dideoxygalactose transaminase